MNRLARSRSRQPRCGPGHLGDGIADRPARGARGSTSAAGTPGHRRPARRGPPRSGSRRRDGSSRRTRPRTEPGRDAPAASAPRGRGRRASPRSAPRGSRGRRGRGRAAATPLRNLSASSGSNRSWSARSSSSAPAARSRPSGSAGSARDEMTTCSDGGKVGQQRLDEAVRGGAAEQVVVVEDQDERLAVVERFQDPRQHLLGHIDPGRQRAPGRRCRPAGRRRGGSRR